ncbi:hypothetical protein LD119_00698 [Mesoplasma sp. JKS002660]|uniref:MarR family transcriptional regulator n=1 Tax=Mesoplasma whartonense TaxID=2878854 RepID=UPI002022B5DC|nr:MarR family transcriptional regulator [Mesoplasma sp. JKS002660]MCL8213747.1 hypothetical protein [Mesoplasma sp. JKS002660]
MKKKLLLENFSQFIKAKDILNSWNVTLSFQEKLVVIYLILIKESGSAVTSQEIIGSLMDLNKSKTSRILNNLEDKGFVMRLQNPLNKRSNIIVLTKIFNLEE